MRRTKLCLRAFRRYLCHHGVELAGLAGIGDGASGEQQIQWLGKGPPPDRFSMRKAALASEEQLMALDSLPRVSQSGEGSGPNAFIGRTLRLRGERFRRLTGLVFLNIREWVHRSDRIMRDLTIAARAFIDTMLCRLFAQMDGFSYDLTSREREVLRALASGMQRAQIAHSFNLAVPTIDLHLGNLRRKLDAATPAEAVAKAHRFGLL
uniref:helix-turn-helix transcriptional regulator n=1 Tax=Parerythrobacter lutipelagi TaxID=1964208 RepID=UPI0013761A75|nr:helix-turn-helix domain-containing protein [Parerythrobacter lutipelagi]